ncbi:glycosyltransferase family 4 protein, partial [Saccharothrix algeriensis]
PWTHPETLTARGAAWHRKVIGRAVARASAIVVPTAAVAAELRRCAPGAAPIRVVPNGVTRWPAERPVPDLPERYVLAVGTIEPRKGFTALVAATAELGVPLVVVGPQGWGGVDLRAPHVRLLGRLGDPELAHVLRRAAVLAAPSLAEGFGLPVVEAMAAGVPVVHSDAPALVEVGGGAGLVVPRGDRAALVSALRSVLGDRGVAERARAAGRVRAEAFTWENAAREVWAAHLAHGRRRAD